MTRRTIHSQVTLSANNGHHHDRFVGAKMESEKCVNFQDECKELKLWI